ncbi:ABC transporter ATP-binding protein [Sporomusa sp.]|uniref:ABC transporter ATP-binding protein n=1 Tax=Sporomusa sp. TaxID=2078658 RepID=UPI002C3EC441|nr:ABC transporter ATP-binding protein [Sporomusa sp.]HWR44738.1 ABC transporter ATP-binding protein [Sporomusa sp.]
MRDIKIVLDNVGKRFGDKVLFENISAGFNAGQCLAVTGKNGSGKSTLLKIVAGLVRPSAGQVRFGGKELSVSERLACTGLVSPDMAMYVALTGVENILFWTKVSGVACAAADAAAFCCQAGLGSAGGDLVQTYSTGMRQRLKLAVLTAISPPVWLLDEPSSNLDAGGKAFVRELIETAIRKKVAVLLATNELEEAGYASGKIEL